MTLPPMYERPPRPLAMARWTVTKFLWWQGGLWIAVAGGLHWWLFIRRSQGTQHK